MSEVENIVGQFLHRSTEEIEVSSHLAKKMACVDMQLPANYTEMHCDEIEYISGEGTTVIGIYGAGIAHPKSEATNYLSGRISTHNYNAFMAGAVGLIAGTIIGELTAGVGGVIVGYAAGQVVNAEASASSSASLAKTYISTLGNADFILRKGTLGINTFYGVETFVSGICCG